MCRSKAPSALILDNNISIVSDRTDGNVNLCSATENCAVLAAPGPGGDNKSSGVSGAVIGGAIGGVVVVLLILGLLLFLYCRRRRRPPSVPTAMSEIASSDVKGKIAPV